MAEDENGAPVLRGNEPEPAFDRLFADWLSARASLEHMPVDVSDEDMSKRLQRVDDLTMKVITAPAKASWTVWRKFDVLEYILARAATVGPFRDHREILAAASVKAALLRTGLAG